MKQQTYRYWIKASIPLLAVVAVGCAQPEPAGRVAQSESVRTRVYYVKAESRADSYEALGQIEPSLSATLASKVMGRISSVLVHEGDVLHEGQPLLRIDSRELEASVSIADANYRSSIVDVESARTTAESEERAAAAKIMEARAQWQQARASLSSAEAKRDLAVAGTRTQEVSQSHLARVKAESDLRLATLELQRTKTLVQDGALAKRELDLAQNKYDAAKAERDIAADSESIAVEGSRPQETRAAEDAVAQARAAVAEAKAGVAQAVAARMQVNVKTEAISVAAAQAQQARAEVRSAEAGLSYAEIAAPFDGRVVRRLVDPGSMATPGSPLLVVEGGEFRLEAPVPESLLRSVRLGEKIPVRVDALKNGLIVSTVREVAPKADAAAHTFLVKLGLPAGPGVKSGMFGRAMIPAGSTVRTLIPAGSAWERDGLHYVFALTHDGIARLRIVTLGARLGDQVDVLSGLASGDRIVMGDLSEVHEGVHVQEERP